MSVVAVGPALDIDGPLPVAPPHSLLQKPGVVQDRDLTRVLNGVNVEGYPAGCASLWEPCSTGTFRLKDDNAELPTPRFDSFAIYKNVVCSSLGMGSPQRFFDRLETVIDAISSAAVERALAEGVDLSTNPFFGDGNVVVLNGGTAVSPNVGLSFLENAIGQTCRMGMIFATPATIASFLAIPDDRNDLVTPNGTPIVSADGIIDIDTTDLPLTTGTEDWMIATGPVEVFLGPIEARDIVSSLDRSDNTVTALAERYAVAYWDTVLQAAVRVDWAL